MKPRAFGGFPADAPRQEAFIPSGQLTHLVVEDVHNRGSGVHVQLTVQIDLNHDRVLAHTIENCLTEIVHSSYSLHSSLSARDPAFVETYVRDQLVAHNGTTAIRSVKLIDYKFIPPKIVTSTQVASEESYSEANDEP